MLVAHLSRADLFTGWRSATPARMGEDDMIETQTPQFEIQVDPWQAGSGEQCRRLIAEAEKEVAAFATAVSEIFGSAAAARAAEYWIELAETLSPHAVEGGPNWRKLTIMASCRLAADSIFAGAVITDAGAGS